MRRLRLAVFSLSLFGLASFADAPARADGPDLQAGLTAAKASDYKTAEAELAKVKGSDEAAALLALANVYLEQGKTKEAAQTATRAAALAPQKKAHAAAIRARALAAEGKLAEAIREVSAVKSDKGDGGRRARLVLGELLLKSGKRKDAEDALHKIIEDYNDNQIPSTDGEGLAVAGRAAHLLRSPKDANTLFNESERVDKKQVELLLFRAELFLEKYDPGHAEEVLREALAIAPERADAKVLLARVKLEQSLDFDTADKLANEALAVNPRHPGAYAVKAGIALRDMELVTAEKAIQKGLEGDPSDLELMSLRAATRFLDDDLPGYEARKKEVFQRNPEYSRFFTIVSDFAEWEHRYDDIVSMMKEATKVDDDDGYAWANLGLTQLRSGDETGGLDALKKAWSKDRYNVRVYNTLNLYEQQIAPGYETVPDGVFKVRYKKEERPMLERYLPRMLGEAFGSMKARYGYVPQSPIQVEMYAGREPFSVRTSGLPNVGIQGVCFGRVIAAISPTAEPANWGNVLWHELGHVFAIQMSKNHVPRWFTEGLSEYETIARRPEWQRELDPELYQALVASRLPGAVDMNRAFTHAEDAQDITVAYYAASQMLMFTVETFGMPRVVTALKAWGQGKKTPEVLKEAFGTPPAEYDARFRAWAMNRLSRYKGQYFFHERAKPIDEAKAAADKAPNDAKLQVALAVALLRAKKGPEAKQALAKALQIDPKQKDALYLSTKIAGAGQDMTEAERMLGRLVAAGGDGYQARMLAANLAEAKKDNRALRIALEAAHRFDPSQGEPLKGLVDLAREEKRDADAFVALEKITQLEQHDHTAWRLYLEAAIQQKDWDKAVRAGESAVFVDVMSPVTHTLYGRALAQKGRHDAAIFEFESALLGKAKTPKDVAATHAFLATSLAARGKKDDARKHRDDALKLDPENAEAKALSL